MSDYEKYDVFIAYYGNLHNGSEQKARELYNQIHNVRIGPNKCIRAYFHPASKPYGDFDETPLIVARTPMFLLVVDKHIPTNGAGQLQQQRADGRLRNLYEEVRSFHESRMYKDPGGDNAAKLFIADDFNFQDAERLHPMFSGRIALSTTQQVLEWIKYFYTNVYVSRLYEKSRYLVHHKRAEFIEGKWVPEAEDIWRTMRSEPIGRSLLIYYVYKAGNGDADAKATLRRMYQEFARIPVEEDSTQVILRKIKDMC